MNETKGSGIIEVGPAPKPKKRVLSILGGLASVGLMIAGPYLILRDKSSGIKPAPVPALTNLNDRQDATRLPSSTETNTTTTIAWPTELAVSTTTSYELFEENLPPETTEPIIVEVGPAPVPPGATVDTAVTP